MALRVTEGRPLGEGGMAFRRGGDQTGLVEPQASQPRTDIFDTPLYQDVKFAAVASVQEYMESRNLNANAMSEAQMRNEVARAVSRVTTNKSMGLNTEERERLIDDVFFEIVGLGPLERLLADPRVDDIFVNGPDCVYVECEGVLLRARTRFRDQEHMMNIIHRIVGPLGRRVDETTPYVDARLPDGSRVNVIIPPVSVDGAMISIRKFKAVPFTANDLVKKGSVSAEMMEFLGAAVRGRLNVLVCGGTGSGKTTLLNILSGFIPDTQRLVSIEDTAELQLHQPHVARLETRPPSPEGGREVTARDLLRNSLRMRPDRIILGEVRSGEAVEMVQAMTTGHDGSMATIHANSPRDALGRLELLLGFGGMSGDVVTLRRQIVSAVQVIVHAARLPSGERKVLKVSEVVGIEGEVISLHDMFTFKQTNRARGIGTFVSESSRSHYADALVFDTGVKPKTIGSYG